MGGSPARVIQNIIKPAAPTPAPMAAAPTTAEVSQVTATSMDGYDSRKTKARGRSMTIMTGPSGVEDQTATLGKVSLLGQ